LIRYTRNALAAIFAILFIFTISCQERSNYDPTPRYIITSPELAELVSIIDGTENIVGVSLECNYPEQLRDIPKVGTFGQIDVEKILRLQPTLVLTAGLEQEEISFQLQKLGIPVLVVFPRSIEDILIAVDQLGAALNKQEEASNLKDSLQIIIDHYEVSQPEKGPRIYLEIYGNPVMSVADSSFLGELVELAGADNIFSTLPRAYSRIKAEDVITLDPEIILLTYPGATAEQVKDRMGWEVISACRNNRIYTVEDVDPDLILRAGPRLQKALEELKKIL